MSCHELFQWICASGCLRRISLDFPATLSAGVVGAGDTGAVGALGTRVSGLRMFGGSAWTKWNRWFQDEIINAQSEDGSWPIPAAKGFGPQGDPGKNGQVYRTALCTLMLEIFYRYLPTLNQ